MDVNLINNNASLNLLTTATVNQAVEASKSETTTKNDGTVINSVTDLSQLSVDDVKNITQEMNKFLQLLNADLKFQLHEGTKQLMVQVIDTKTQKVLKEFPPHELLDTIAKIRDYVGVLLDKKV
ncbi:MAG TPA: flagellar protein FlaG [Desulfitobacteriaceae bacterium]|nr:flagellar protein FlaG [Desulfitobacteriaceae bacterium]